MAGFYKWNVEQISNLARKVESEAGDLQRDSQNLERLKQDVQSSWQSVAGTEYAGSLDINKGEIDQLIREAEEMKSDLDKAARTYSQAEQNIRNILSTMCSKIEH